MLFIGICGASGSGKSTLAEALRARLGERCYVINQDAYYRDHPQLSFAERSVLNYDEPEIFDHDLLLEDVKALLKGQPITRKAYDYTQHRRADTQELIYPHDVMILEGIHCFHDERLMELMYLKLYMDVEPDIDGISMQYLSTVKPMYDKYIRNYVKHADVIVAHGGRNARIVDILVGYVQDELGKRRM